MFWIDILVVLGLALIFSILLTHGLRWRHPVREDAGAAMAFLFIVFALILWTVLLWGPPVGPVWAGQSWVGVLLAGLFLALLLAAAVPPQRALQKPPKPLDEAEAEKEITAVFGCFFWVLLLLLVTAISVRFFGWL